MGNLCTNCNNSEILAFQKIKNRKNKPQQLKYIFDSYVIDNDKIESFLEENSRKQQTQDHTLLTEEESKDQENDRQQIEESEFHVQNYEKILKSQCVRCLNIQINHHYADNLKQSSNIPQKLKRLNQEIKVLTQNLPIYSTNAIFIIYDEQRMDTMKALMFGSSGTPYAHGAFIYDIHADDTYPTKPPKVNLMTNGNKAVRFNPNLYSNGYVCLSLLGTWSGSSQESWNAATSNILQVLLSIQSLVMNEDIYFNEPSYEREKKTENGKHKNRCYSNIVKYANVKYAMNEILKNPPKQFEEIIKVSFALRKELILKEVEEWIKEAEEIKDDPSYYDGLVQIHNSLLANQFKTQGKYLSLLKEEYQILKRQLNSLKLNEMHKIIQKWSN